MPRDGRFRGERTNEWLRFAENDGKAVAEIQEFLQSKGFFPFGVIDGVCGYRTASSMRLYQEYVRSVDGSADIGAPDGIFGPKSLQHVRRWRHDGIVAEWHAHDSSQPQPEYRDWMRLLSRVKTHYLQQPTRLLQRIADYDGATDTRPIAAWDFDPQRIHLVGIRRHEAQPGKRENDDVFILLINGSVFKFYGTTDPGKSSHRSGAPFLVHGQHRYRFGWHKQSDRQKVYRALKPRTSGVLIVRDGDRDFALTRRDLEGRLENNASINIHWGGRGVSNWSEGCQVICGRAYVNHRNDLVDCTRFAATTYSTLGTRVNGDYQTKGAYSVLVDLVTAFSGDEHALDYMLLYEEDLRLDPGFGDDMAAKINAVMQREATG
ncbi:MAG: peptidoglycan-binding protein [Gammaproteobacteria bacterium]|nr:peptidoglycan-binding protein [Gammaproteobacteria bacterium]